MKLTAKLLLTFLLTAMIPVAVLGYLSYGAAKDALQEQALEDLAMIADAKEGHLYSFLDGVKGRAIDFSSDGLIRDSAEALGSLDPEDPRYDATVRALNMHLKLNKMPLDKSIHMIAVIDLNGRIIATTEEEDIGRDERSNDYFIYGKKGVYVSDVRTSTHVAASEHPYHIAVSTPLTSRETGALLGVIVNFYDTLELDKILSGEFLVEKGVLSAEPARRETMEVYLVNKEGFMITASRFMEGVVLKQRVESEPVQRCSEEKEMTGVYKNYLGTEVIGASMCIPGMGWTLLTEIGTEEAFAPVAALRRKMMVVGGIIAGLVMFLAYFIATGITTPLIILTRATRKFAKGDFDARVQVETKDEIGMLASAFNHTARELKTLYSNLSESEERVRSVVETASDAIVSADSSGTMVSWNHAAGTMFGYSAKEAVGKPITLLMPERFHKAHQKGLERVASTGKTKLIGEMVELAGLRKDGSEFPIELSIGKWETGEGVFFAGIIRDITERKRAEEKIEQNYHIQRVINSILQISLQPTSLVEQLERTLDTIFSIPWLAVQSKGCIFLVEDDPEVLVMAAQRGLAKPLLSTCAKLPFGRCLCGRAASTRKIEFADRIDEHHEIRFQGMAPHGHVCVPILSGSRVLGLINLYVDEGHQKRGDEGEFLTAVANTLAGVIERKRAERAIKKYAAQLEDANRLKDLFTDIMRHDLLNPVTVIKGVSQLLMQESSEKTQEGLEKIMNSAEKVEVMIESASKYAKLEDAEELDFQELDLNEVLKEVISSFKPLLDEKKMKLSYKDKGKKPVMGNPMIEEVFANLVSNAVKYSPGGSEIVIEIEDMDKDWRVAVKDLGKGVADEYKKAVFERFERGGKQGVKGTGLGLAIVKRIVELHKGRVWVEDNPEGGSIFYVEIPKKRDKPT